MKVRGSGMEALLAREARRRQRLHIMVVVWLTICIESLAGNMRYGLGVEVRPCSLATGSRGPR